MDYMFIHTSLVNIPAYDACHNGLLIEFKLTAFSNHKFLVNTTGKAADALQRNFIRVIEIMSSMKRSWECLQSLGYLLECCNDQYIVRDSKSSSMALSIALINVYRAAQGQPSVKDLSGTGILRIDGSFERSHLEEKKYFAAKSGNLNKFITPNKSRNLLELESLINQLN